MLAAIVVSVVIIGVALVIGSAKRKTLMEDGTIVERDKQFWENATLFDCAGTYDDVENAVRSLEPELTRQSVVTEYSKAEKTIIFKSKYAWNAYIEYKGQRDGKNVFEFAFAAWKTRNGMPYNVLNMNVILTALEKAMLSIDPQTTVETHKMKIKTK